MALTYEQRQWLRHAVSRARQLKLGVGPRPDTPKCAKCGCDMDNKTRGCKTCMNRHARRSHWASDKNAREECRKAKVCTGCRQSWYDETPGCKVCYERARSRRRLAEKREARKRAAAECRCAGECECWEFAQ